MAPVTPSSSRATITMGVDIGQKHDPTAICVAELAHRSVEDRTEAHYVVRHLERLPLGTPYPDVAQRIAHVAIDLDRKTGAAPHLYLDATGVGQPVVDLLRNGQPALRHLVAVNFVHGDRRTEKQSIAGRQVSLGKEFLVCRLQALLQAGRLHLPRNQEAQALARELLNYEIRIGNNATGRYGAFRAGTHDDLVTALGLAIHAGSRQTPIRSRGSINEAAKGEPRPSCAY